MIKRVLIIILAINVMAFIYSCCDDDGDLYLEYKWSGFDIDLLDNSGIEPVVSENDSIGKKAFGMRISTIDTVFYYAHSYSLSNVCYAFVCHGEDYEYIRLHDITSIQIKTINDYSNDYLANSDITKLFVSREPDKTKKDYISIDEMITNINNNDHAIQIYDLILMDTTCIGGSQIFEIELSLSDGVILKNQSNSIILK